MCESFSGDRDLSSGRPREGDAFVPDGRSPGIRSGGRFHDRRLGPRRSRRELVERAEAYLRAQVGARVPFSTLCRVVGVSERALRNAFYQVRGMSPKRSMLAERLQGARRALSDTSTGRTTVTGVATQYGFYELGRFAAAYKEAFGETPSVTLRRTAAQRPVEQMSSVKGDRDVCTS
jgi:transcriptional regulator GlxA family with amidase domain